RISFTVASSATTGSLHPFPTRRSSDLDLHPVDARRERRDDQPAGRAREDLLEGLDDLQLGSREAAPIDVRAVGEEREHAVRAELDRKSTRLNSSHVEISYAVFCLKKKR